MWDGKKLAPEQPGHFSVFMFVPNSSRLRHLGLKTADVNPDCNVCFDIDIETKPILNVCLDMSI